MKIKLLYFTPSVWEDRWVLKENLKQRDMKKIKFLSFLVSAMMMVALTVSCGNNDDKEKQKEEVQKSGANELESSQADTLKTYLLKLDSINAGELNHLVVYKLGKLKSVDFNVYSVERKNNRYEYINLRKDCGGDYYYNWVDAILLVEEVKYFISAIDSMSSNFNRQVDNEERYSYITNKDIRLMSYNENKNGGKWTAELSINYKLNNSSITLSKDDLSSLKKLLQDGERKILELRKASK